MDIGLAKNLANSLDVKLEIIQTTWSTLSGDLKAKRFDIAMGGISITDERRKIGFLSTGYLDDGKTPIARCDEKSNYDSLEKIDRPSIRVIVNPGGSNEKFVKENLHHAAIITYPDNNTIFDQILLKKADLMITDSNEVDLMTHLHRGLCETTPGKVFNPTQKGYFMPMDEEWNQYVNAWLKNLLQNHLIYPAYGAAIDQFSHPTNPPEIIDHFEVGKIILQNPTPEIKYAYYYYVPKNRNPKQLTPLFLSTDGGPDYEKYEELVKSLFMSRIVPLSRLAEEHGYVFVMPILPRNYGPYPAFKMGAQLFSRYTLFPAPFDTKSYEFDKRPDLEILKIIDHLSEELAHHQIKTHKKIFIGGFSSGGVVANRFSILYPERIAAVAIGSAGVFLYPLKSWKGTKLTYPIGVADLNQIPRPRINLKDFKKIPHLVFVGDQDLERGHSPVPEDPEHDREELFDKSQSKIILEYFGKTNIERAQKFASYLRSIGMTPKFILYRGIGHQYTEAMKHEIFRFFDAKNRK